MPKPTKAIGKMACLCCGEQITVKQSETGTLNVNCPDCDFSGYGKAGTDAHRAIFRRITLRPTPAQDASESAKPAPRPAPAPAPAPVKRNTIFG
jgi:hypothetical protein